MCSLICSFFFYLSRQLGYVPFSGKGISFTLFPTSFSPFPFRAGEYFWFAVLGILIGICGGMFITVFVALIKIRNRIPFLAQARFWNVLLLCVIISAVDYHLPLLKGTPGQTTSILFGVKPLQEHNKFLYLSLLIIFKYIFTMLSMTLPIPSGQVVQSFVMGAGFGRLFGEVLNLFLADKVYPPGYAVLGAAAWAASTTRSFSMILIMLEMTGQLTYLVPTMMTVAFAIATANLFTDSIYDIMIKVRNLPYLALPDAYTRQNVLAYNIMNTNVDAVTTESTLAEIKQLLKTRNHDVFPVIDNHENRLLLGEVNRKHLKQMLKTAMMGGNSSNVLQPAKKKHVELPSTSVIRPYAQPTHHTINEDSSQVDMLDLSVGDNVLAHSNASNSVNSSETPSRESRYDPFATETPIAQDETSISTLRQRSSASPSSPQDNNNNQRIHHGASMRVVIHAAQFLAVNKKDEEQLLLIDPSPFCITELTTMNKIYYLFTMLGLGHAWVTSFGKLTGVVTKKQLIKVGRDMDNALGKTL
jgi:chloride channel 2